MIYQGIATVRFDASHEILSLGDALFQQNADYSAGNYVPAINPPPDQAEQIAQSGSLASAL